MFCNWAYRQVRLVGQLILNDWLLKRANQRVLEVAAAPVGNEENCHPADWESAQEHKLELMQWYKTTAERRGTISFASWAGWGFSG